MLKIKQRPQIVTSKRSSHVKKNWATSPAGNLQLLKGAHQVINRHQYVHTFQQKLIDQTIIVSDTFSIDSTTQTSIWHEIRKFGICKRQSSIAGLSLNDRITYLEEFYSRQWITCMRPFPYPSWCAHLPAIFEKSQWISDPLTWLFWQFVCYD